MEDLQESGDDIVRVRQSSLIGLNREAGSIPLISNSIKAHKAGGYLSAFRGRGMEFHESRLYQPGDDIRAIDWRVTARSGKTHTKVYREERERPVLLWVDLQQSMFFGTRNYYKSVLASRLAALLAWSSVQHGDRLGGLIFSEHEHIESRPKRGKAAALHFIQQLVGHSAWSGKKSNAADENPDSGLQALNRLRQVARPGSLIVLISDFRFLNESCRIHLAQLARHNDVVLLFTHDPLERELPPAGQYRLTDGVSELSIDSADRASRQQYHQRFSDHYQSIERLCNQLQLFLIDISTADDMLETLKTALGLRRVRNRR